MPEIIKLAVHPHSSTDVFDPSIDGVEPITKIGTEVQEDLEKEIRRVARENGVRLRKTR